MLKDSDIEAGNRLRKLRNFRGITNAVDFCTFMREHRLFIGPTQLCAMERGEKHINADRLAKFAAALRVTPAYFLTDEGSPVSEHAASEIKNPCGEHLRGHRTYADITARAMDEAEERSAALLAPHTCHGGDMLASEPCEAWNDADSLIRGAWAEAVEPFAIPTPIHEVDSRLQERYSQRKVHLPRDTHLISAGKRKLRIAVIVVLVVIVMAFVIGASHAGDKPVDIQQESDTSPKVFTSNEADGTTCLVMPMRT